MEASGFASGLYWVIRIVLLIFGGRGRGWAGRVAPVFGRLNLRIEPQVEKRFWGENPLYEHLVGRLRAMGRGLSRLNPTTHLS